MNINDLFILRWISASMLALGWLRYRMTSFSSRSSAVQTSQEDGGPEVGNLQDKQYHRSSYANEAHYRQGKNATVKTWEMNLSGKIQDGSH